MSNRSPSKNKSRKTEKQSAKPQLKTKGKIPKFGPLEIDDGDDAITNHNPMEINHPDPEPVLPSKPCNTLWNKPDIEKDNPLLRVPRHRGGYRDDLSVTNTSIHSHRSITGNQKQSLGKKA